MARASPPRSSRRPPPARWGFPWPAFAIGAAALAAGRAGFLVLRPVPASQRVTVLLTSQDQAAWIVAAERDALRLATLNPRAVPEGRVFELWALPPGTTAPTSLGLIPSEGRLTVSPRGIRPEPGMPIEITLEPPGGSPTGRPTGPIQFIGRLAPARGL